jgi:hypothetical protein
MFILSENKLFWNLITLFTTTAAATTTNNNTALQLDCVNFWLKYCKTV